VLDAGAMLPLFIVNNNIMLALSDGFDAFIEAGDAFDSQTAQRLRKHIYSSGGSLEPGLAYRLFRGR
jgi:Zn-dependent oligopeptidase